ncbi:MAG TPA: hypothetical protein VGG65_02355, partial [Thermoanaerobaculia bacterium]
MRSFLAIARREFVEKRLILVAATVGSTFPFVLMGIASRGRSFGTAEDRALVSVVIAALLAIVLAVAFGASILARETAEGRLGFYFSRPISATSIWTGKVGGAVAVIATSAAITL